MKQKKYTQTQQVIDTLSRPYCGDWQHEAIRIDVYGKGRQRFYLIFCDQLLTFAQNDFPA